MQIRSLPLLAAMLGASGCVGVMGAECQLDSECEAPLVCRRMLCIDPRLDAGPERDAGTPTSDVPAIDGGARDVGTGTDAPAVDSGEPHVRDHLLLEADFEGTDPFGDFDIQGCCDHSVSQSSEHARSGTSSFRSEVRASDPSVSSGWRGEILPRDVSDEGERWYGFSIYFETPDRGGIWEADNGHFVQWHPDNSYGSASLALWAADGVWDVATNPTGERGGTHHVQPGTIATGRWHDVVFHVDWDASLVQVWADAELLFEQTDIPYEGQYFKLGMNRWGSGPGGAPTSTWVIFYDDLRIGDAGATYEDVAP